MVVDNNIIFSKIFDIIEPALESAGYKVLEGDEDTAYVLDPDGNDIEIKLNECEED